MGKWLTIDERKQFRTTIKTLTDFNANLENSLRKQLPIPLAVRQHVNEMTGCSDMREAYDAMLEIKEVTQASYLSQILEMAPKSLSAFAEYMNPDEPPAPHHEFLIEHLEAIELGDLIRMLLSMPPGHAKPLTLDTPVLDEKGTYRPLGDIAVGDIVISHTGAPRAVLAIHDNGILPVYTITLASGRVIKAAADHPFLTGRGWIEASKLTTNDFLTPVVKQTPPHPLRSDLEFAVAGSIALAKQFVSGTVNPKAVNIYVDLNRPGITDEIIHRCKLIGLNPEYAFKTKAKHGLVAQRIYFPASDYDRLMELDLLSADIPTWVKEGSAEQIKEFLDCAWRSMMCDYRHTCFTDQWRAACFYTATEKQSEDLKHLLWQCGINANHEEVQYVATKNVKGYSMYAKKIIKFSHRVVLGKNESSRFYEVTQDIIEVQLGVTQGYMTKLFHTNVDRIVEVKRTKQKEQMVCLTVETDHSFTAHGVATHNSTYSSHLFPAWFLGRNPKKRYLQAGHTQKFCEDELGKRVRNYIRSENYADVFPEITIAHDTSAAATWALNKYNGKYMARAVGQGIAGLRAHIAGVDDPYPRLEEANSATYREQVYNWFNADFKTRLLPGSPLFVVATRWHPDDLCGVLAELSKSGKILPFTVLNLPCICVDPVNDPLNRAKGDLLWEFFDAEYISDMKASQSLYVWESLYQGNPIPESGNMLKPEWIKRYELLPKSPDFVTISADTANKATERSDYTAITVWYQYGNDHYLVDVIRKRMEYTEIKAKLEYTARFHKANVIIVEDAGTGTQYHQEANQTDYTPPCPVVAIKPHGSSKEFKYDAALPMFEAGHVYLPVNSDWLGVYEKELLEFPTVTHDDQVDSTSQYLLYRRAKANYGSQKMGATGTRKGDRSKLFVPPPASNRFGADMTEAEDA